MGALVRRWTMAALLLGCAFAAPLHAATVESARAALDEALPDLPDDTDAAFMALLVSMGDGDELSVRYNLLSARFRCVGDVVEVLAPAWDVSPPVAADGSVVGPDVRESDMPISRSRAGLVVDLDQWLDLDRVAGRLKDEYGPPSSQSEAAVTFQLPDTQETLTITAEGLVCVIRRGPASGLSVVDGFMETVVRVVEAAAQVHVALADTSREDLLRRSVVYSHPKESYARAWFLIGPQRLTDGRLPDWTRGLASGIEATALIPSYAPPPAEVAEPEPRQPADEPTTTRTRGARGPERRPDRVERPATPSRADRPVEARLRVWAVGMGSMPSFKVNGRRVIRGVEGDKGGGEGPPDKHGSADITEALRPGENRIETIETPYAAACVVCIELIAPPGESAAFELVAGRTVQVTASAPLARLLTDWPPLAAVLPPDEMGETESPGPPPL